MSLINRLEAALRSGLAGLVIAAATLPVADTASAQDRNYPPGELEIIVPFNAGGSADRMVRAIAR